MYTEEKCKEETLQHIKTVRQNINKIMEQLIIRAGRHDLSKLYEPELSAFTNVNNRLSKLTYGSDKYKSVLQNELKEALDHHYSNNSHHPEHYSKYICNICSKEYKKEQPEKCNYCLGSEFIKESDMSQMDLIDVIEMFCDWQAACQRHDDGDINKSITINKDRFKYPTMLEEIFRNTIKYLD